MMNQQTTATVLPTVSEIVRADYRTADVFRKWGINFCCGGNQVLAEVCTQKKLDMSVLQNELDQATKNISISNALQFDAWPVVFLVDYITHVHHGYLKKVLPALSQSIFSFVAGHAKKYPYLAAVEQTFGSLSTELMEHTEKEEESIFPYVKQVSHTFERREIYGPLFMRTMRKPFSETINKQHNRISHLLLQLREQTNNYRFNNEACTNHQVIYHKLKEFDADLVQHKHLENNILFPKVLEMEKSLLQF